MNCIALTLWDQVCDGYDRFRYRIFVYTTGMNRDRTIGDTRYSCQSRYDSSSPAIPAGNPYDTYDAYGWWSGVIEAVGQLKPSERRTIGTIETIETLESLESLGPIKLNYHRDISDQMEQMKPNRSQMC